MTSPDIDRIQAALARVNDPEIKRPITELGMVEDIAVDDTGMVRVTVLLTVAGCPMKDTITTNVTAEVSRVEHVTGVDDPVSHTRAMLQTTLSRLKATAEHG